MTTNTETQLVAARECLADMPARDLAQKLIEAQANALDLERKLDKASDTNVELHRMIQTAESVLGTVVSVVGARDLLTICEVVRCEVLRLRKDERLF